MAINVSKSRIRAARWRPLWLLLIPVLWCVCGFFNGLTFLENKLVDWRFRFRGEQDAPVKVVYVDIDSKSISEIGGFPWSRQFFARVAAALIEQAKVKAVGIDIVFSENGVAEAIDWKKRVEGNRELARYLASNPPVVVAASYAAAVDRDINGQPIHRELPLLSKRGADVAAEAPEVPSFRLSETSVSRQWTPALVGLIDTIDAGTRTVPAYAPTEVRPYLHMSIELARLHYGITSEGVKILKDRIELRREDGGVVANIPLREGQLLDINWFSAWQSPLNPRVSFSDVYNYAMMLGSENDAEKKTAAEFFTQAEFRDAMVLIGPVDPLIQDLGVTPFDNTPVPKVGVHGNLVKTIVSGKYLHRLPEWRGVAWLDYFVVVGLSVLVGGLATAAGARSVRNKFAAALVLAAYVGFAFWIFGRAQLILPLALPIGAALTTSFVAITWQLIREEKQKGRIKGMFGTYLSPQLVDRMVESGEDPQLGGHESEITAYFSDIQSFSTFSENLPSGPLVELMNEYLTACTDIVQEEGGTLDKYIGDAVVAMFGAPVSLPDHAFRACVASQRVHQRLAELCRKWEGEGEKWPAIVGRMRTRIGLNSGLVTIGNVGSRTRFNYTMMGDNVNLAARMESGAKAYGVHTMVTETTKQACDEHGPGRLVFRFLDRIVVKGRAAPVAVFEVVGLKENVTAEILDCLRNFDMGMKAYLSRDFVGAVEAFRSSAMVEPHRPDGGTGVEVNPSMLMIERCRELGLNPPPPDWDGVYRMKVK